MPQFDIASFYPQITFFAAIFLVLYIYLTKNILPKIGQNAKLYKRIADIYTNFSVKRPNISYIYQPKNMTNMLIQKESISLVYLNKAVYTITCAFISSLNWLINTQYTDSKIRLLTLNSQYLNILNDIFGPHTTNKK